MTKRTQAAAPSMMHTTRSIRWPNDLSDELMELAAADGRDFSNLVIHTMRQALPDLRKRILGDKAKPPRK
jgi:hypothetical protein